MFWLWIPLLFLNVLSGYIFFVNDFEKPAIWISVYAIIYRHVWGLGIAFILLGFGFRVGCKRITINLVLEQNLSYSTKFVLLLLGILRNLMNHHVFIVLGRAAYCVFLTHAFIIRVYLGSMRSPAFLNESTILRNATGCAFTAYAFGVLIYLVIEIPFSNLQKLIVHSFAAERADKFNNISKFKNDSVNINNNNNVSLSKFKTKFDEIKV